MSSRPFARLAALAVLAVLALAAPAAADPIVEGEFPVAGLDTNNKLAAGGDGNVWVTVSDGANDVARITPAGEVTPFDLGVSGASGIAADADGNLWVTYEGGVVRFDPADPAGRVATPVAAIRIAHSIVLGPDGNLWVATAERVVKIPPGDPAARELFDVPGLGPRDIDVAGEKLAIADFGSSRIVLVTTAGAVTDIPTAVAPQGVAGGSGGAIAFSLPADALGVLMPPGPARTLAVPATDPFGVAHGSDGAYWSALFLTDSLARFGADGSVTAFGGFSAGSGPRQLSPGPGGEDLWVTLPTANRVARVTGIPVLSMGAGGPPETRIVKGPGKRVRAKRVRGKGVGARVKFRFRSLPPGARFQCALVRLGRGARRARRRAQRPRFKGCKSPRSYRLKPGRYRFLARAVQEGLVDPTPAKRAFRVVRP